MAAPFRPDEHPALLDLGDRLRELAGDSAYKAGVDYLKKGLVKQGAVAGTTAFATVTGSTDYRVSIAFGEQVKVTCTCPAHRRNRYCKHVVAVCEALLRHPGDFAVTEAAPEVEQTAKPKRSRAAGGKGRKAKAAEQEEQRRAGLETVDRLLEELAAGGLMTLGAEKASLIAGTGELVRGLKLRRLGNIVMALQRVTGGESPDPGEFAQLLIDLYLTRCAVGAHLEGRIDPVLAEDLVGKTWRDSELERVRGLNLIEVGYEHRSDGEFRIETSYLIDTGSGKLFAEKQITPVRRSAAAKPRYRHRLVVEEAGLYPGDSPRRIKLMRARRAPLTSADANRVVERGLTAVAHLRHRLAQWLASPFAGAEMPVLVRPSDLLVQDSLVGLVDDAGHFVRVTWPSGWTKELADLLPEAGGYALFGLLSLDAHGLDLRCLSVIAPALRWSRGPVYPEPGR